MRQIFFTPKPGVKPDFSHRLLKQCVAWYPLNEGAGNIAFDIVGNHHASDVGTSTWNRDPLFGKTSRHDILVGDYFKSNLDFSGEVACSWSLWLWPVQDLDSPTDWRGVFSQRDTDGTQSIGCFAHNTIKEYAIRFIGTTESNGLYTANTGNWQSNVWYHLVATFDGKTSKIFLNGKLNNTYVNATKVPLNTTNGTFNIGTYLNPPNSTGSTTWEGRLANFRLWNRVLTEEEAMNLYDDPFAGFEKLSTAKYFLPLSIEQSYVRKKVNLRCTLKLKGASVRI